MKINLPPKLPASFSTEVRKEINANLNVFIVMDKKVIRLTEDELHKIMKNATMRVINENDLLRDATSIGDELMEYARLDKEDTGLDIDIFVDDGGAYKRNGHNLWVYVRNGYTDSDPFFHIDVSSNPSAPHINYNISKMELEAVLIFISQNAELLKSFADEKIEHLEFYELCRPVICDSNQQLREMSLNEMATLHPNVSGLPTILWIDEGTSPQHGMRIKFKASDEQTNTRQFTSMSISQNPQIFNLPKKCSLSSKALQRITDFVKANEINLLKVARQEMKFKDFLQVMIRT